MSDATPPSVETHESRKSSYAALAAMFFVGAAILLMVASKQMKLHSNWEHMSENLTKGLLYVASGASMAVAFICGMVAITRHGFRPWEVRTAAGSWCLSLVGYYVVFVWWPTPEWLVIAASQNDFSRVKRCLWFKVDINAIAPNSSNKAASRRTALTAALRENRSAMVDFLLKQGADPNRLDGEGFSPFESTKSQEVEDRLLLAGADINAKNGQGLSPLERLAHWPDGMNCPNFDERQARVLSLVSRGAEITESVRLKAMNRSDLRLAVLLETLRREKSLPDTNPFLAFLVALMFAEEEVAFGILREHPEWANPRLGLKLPKPPRPGNTPTFSIALRFGRAGPLREWLAAAQGSEWDLEKRYFRQNAVDIAATHGHVEILELLKEFGADLATHPKPDHREPLKCAALHNQLKAAEWLIQQGVDINACRHPSLGDSPLAAAIQAGHLEMVELLVEHGASLDMKHYETRTMFDLAVDTKHPQIAEFLLARGAKPGNRVFYEPWARKMLQDAGFQVRQ